MCKMCLIIKTFITLCGLHMPYIIFTLQYTWLRRSLHAVPTFRKEQIILKKIYKYPIFHVLYCLISPVPLAARSKAQACGRLPAEIVVSNPTGGMDVYLLGVVCVLSSRGLCDVLITRPEESYKLWCVVVCDLKTSWMRRPWPTECCCAQKNTMFHFTFTLFSWPTQRHVQWLSKNHSIGLKLLVCDNAYSSNVEIKNAVSYPPPQSHIYQHDVIYNNY